MISKKILIVEDNADLTDAYELVFGKEGFDVKTAYDGKQALELLKTFTPDIILLDIMMPYMNGFEFLQRIHSSNQHARVVINSNLTQDAEIKKGLELGAVKYLRKSDHTVFELVEEIKKIMGSDVD